MRKDGVRGPVSLLWLYLSPRGRIGRTTFFVSTAVYWLAYPLIIKSLVVLAFQVLGMGGLPIGL